MATPSHRTDYGWLRPPTQSWLGDVPATVTELVIQYGQFGDYRDTGDYHLDHEFLPNAKIARGRRFRQVGLGERLEYMRKNFPWSELSSWTREKLATSKFKELKLISQLWLSIEDSLLMSTPESLCDPDTFAFTFKMWKWVISNSVQHRGRKHITKLWKSLTTAIKWYASASENPRPTVPRGTILFDEKGEFRTGSLTGAWVWLASVKYGVKSKSIAQRLAHFVSTRGLPAPSIEEFEDEVNAHGDLVTSVFPEDPERIRFLRELSKQLGKYCASRARQKVSEAHLSLSNSACFESSRRSGGRSSYIGEQFTEWLVAVPATTRRGVTHFGLPFWEEAGIARFRTQCRTELLVRDRFLRSDDFGEELDFISGTYANPVNALDASTGYQLLQWSIEVGLRRGRLKGSDAIFDEKSDQLTVGQSSEVRVVPIGEPGGKVRTITASEAWVTEFLSPFGHEMISWLRNLPAARSGLSAAAQAYEFVKHSSYKEVDETSYLLSSDLRQASEALVRGYTKSILYGFCEGLGCLTPFFQVCIDLLCAPFYLSKAEVSFYEHLGRETTRGCLMGNPGTKAALMLTMLVSEEEAYRRYLRPQGDLESLLQLTSYAGWRNFAAAGDDHVATGPRGYLVEIDRALIMNGAILALEKCFLSKHLAFFTEECIVNFPDTIWKSVVPLHQRDYETTPHVDSIKVRLLSPCTKITLVQEEKNPAIGKALQLSQKISWLSARCKPGLSGLAIERFRQRFKRYLNWSDVFTYLPMQLGGLNLPFKGSIEELPLMLLDLPKLVLKGLVQAALNADCNFAIRSCLFGYRANTTFRGSEDIVSQVLDQIRFVFRYAEDTKNLEQLREICEVPLIEWDKLRFNDKARLARQRGYLSLGYVVETLQRPVYFKEVLAGESTEIDALESKKIFDSLRQSCLRDAHEYNMTLSDYLKRDPDLRKSYRDFESKFNSDSWAIQTNTAQRVADGLVRRSVPKSFSSKPFSVRRREMEESLLEAFDHYPSPDPSLDDLERLSVLLKQFQQEGVFKHPPYGDSVFVRAERLRGLCTLETPLREGQPVLLV